MNRLVAVLSLVALASAQQLTWMCRPYAFMKVMESCVGKAAVDEEKMMMMTTVRDTCLSRPTVWMEDEEHDEHMHMMGPGMKGPGMKGPGMKGPGMKGPMKQEMMPMNDTDNYDYSIDYTDPEYADAEPEPEPEPGMDGMMGGMMEHMMEEMVENIKGGMKMGPDMYPVLSNISCIMEEMKWMDKHRMPNVKAIKKMIKSLNLNPMITMMMCKDVDTCAHQSTCSGDMDSPFGYKMSMVMNFLRCVGYKMFACCAMNEMMMKMPIGPMEGDVTKQMAVMTAHMARNAQTDPEEMGKEGIFMMIMQTMFGPMSPFMQ